MSITQFQYKNIEQKTTPNCCITRKVIVYNNGKGYKSITTHCPQKSSRKSSKISSSRRKTIKKPLTKQEIEQITKYKFIPGLFHDCKN